MRNDIKGNCLTLSEVYQKLGCSKQNISYWKNHSYSTQAKKSIYDVIRKAAEIFGLDDTSSESLANSAGLSLDFEGGDLVSHLGYKGCKTDLCKKAMISERMFWHYKTRIPTKEAILALTITLDKNCGEIDLLLHKYGYCLSDSIITDVVVRWNLVNYHSTSYLDEINSILSNMGLPLLMTRQV